VCRKRLCSNTKKAIAVQCNVNNASTQAAQDLCYVRLSIQYELPSDATMTIEILDALQRTVLAPMTAEVLKQGEHDIAISIGSLPSVAYTVRVRAVVANGKMLAEQRPLIIAR
jgi:hypothetical protein